MNRIKKAMAFAQKAHAAQSYGVIYPYTKHLEDVYKVLLKFGFTEEKDLDILVASWLHDSIEDTATSYSDLKKDFGEDIAEIVYGVTDEMGRNRKEKKVKTYPKTRANPMSVILKVADRIANVEFSLTQEDESSFIGMYRKEFADFQYNLRIYRQIDPMWEYLAEILKVNPLQGLPKSNVTEINFGNKDAEGL
jgi:guanosine-3',5'-bis(diphosphate) 3'-pyrophosphohydrolase